MDAATWLPSGSWMSAITTIRAPWLANRRAVSSPMPLAPPVIITTFPANFWVLFCIELAESAIPFLFPREKTYLKCSYIYTHIYIYIYIYIIGDNFGITHRRPSFRTSFSFYARFEFKGKWKWKREKQIKID